MLEVRVSSRFKKSFKKVKSYKNFKQKTFDYVIFMLSSQIELPKKYKDHELIGNHKDKRECHLAPDLLLIYIIEDDTIYLDLLDIGSHSNLF
jgi:mRNA interferase YafQ